MIKIDNVQGLTKLTNDEMQNTNGGDGGCVGLAIFLYLLSEFDDIKKGFEDAANGKKPNP